MRCNFNCPVCNSFRFTEPLEDEIEEERFCNVCGWVYNENEINHPEILDGYKKEFAAHREKDPNWNYLDSIGPKPTPHKCPVCGKYEFEDEGSYDICPYCGWEDDDIQSANPQYNGGANKLSLNDFRTQYSQKLKNNPSYKWIDNK